MGPEAEIEFKIRFRKKNFVPNNCVQQQHCPLVDRINIGGKGDSQ